VSDGKWLAVFLRAERCREREPRRGPNRPMRRSSLLVDNDSDFLGGTDDSRREPVKRAISTVRPARAERQTRDFIGDPAPTSD